MTPEQARARLEEIERDRVAIMRAQSAKLADYIGALSPSFGPPEWVRRALVPIFAAARHEPARICLSVPPRHGKTYTTLHALAEWVRDTPRDTCAYASYNSRIAKSKSRIMRDLAIRGGAQLARDMKSLSEWRTVGGGGMLAGGVASGLTGEGLQGLLVVDDPFKDRKDADSALRRQTVWEWFNSAAYTRLEGASTIVIQTRWHHDDIIGRLQKLGGWKVINLPAVAGENDPMGRKPGEPLDPIRFPRRRSESLRALAGLDEIRSQIGEYEWAALYQGNPQPRGNKLFETPHYYNADAFKIDGCRVIIGADPAASESTAADHSAAVVLAVRGRPPDAKVYVLEAWRGQVSVPRFVQKLVDLQRRWFGALVAVEAVGGFRAVPDMLKQLDPSIRVLIMPARGDKFQRAQPVSAAWNRGDVLLPLSGSLVTGQRPTPRPWIGPFVDELDRFTGVGGGQDDQVDALAHGFNAIAYQPVVYRGAVVDTSYGR